METLKALPVEREDPFQPPALLKELPGSLHPMTYADGRLGWLVTGYAEARAVLDDPRFSNTQQGAAPPIKELAPPEGLTDLVIPPGFFIAMDDPEHSRYRKLLTGHFSMRKMRKLEPRIQEVIDGQLDEMARGGAPADLVKTFALPIPSLVICELLGVPYDERSRFQDTTARAVNLDNTVEQRGAAAGELMGYLSELVGRKRAEPGQDLLSELATGGELDHEELTGVATLLLTAGHETTANMLGLGTFLLLCHPEQADLVRTDPGVAESAVEELMRYLSVTHIGPIRVARADVPLAGQTIKAGQTVTICLPVVNRDPSRFPAPDHFDVTRQATQQLGFSHGIHQCLGQQLARLEMRLAYPALLRRFPTLRLAVPAEEVPLRPRAAIYGVAALPVTW
ncbi:cytochrome P450 [Nonomuraea angiospora]|uniref:Cytochrome P450 n=1 Tax=Nonomuraea angiospora TaxID=46172 RepID=A0ABR9LPK6_9ACTN|nr:cytochrome P450 [Nonomuraea angiospora]MBE1582586.1 cytochrome P450 [Nonomuraea angiospora]